MWIDFLLLLIAVLPLFSRNKIRLENADASPTAIAGQPTIPPQIRL